MWTENNIRVNLSTIIFLLVLLCPFFSIFGLEFGKIFVVLGFVFGILCLFILFFYEMIVEKLSTEVICEAIVLGVCEVGCSHSFPHYYSYGCERNDNVKINGCTKIDGEAKCIKVRG